jgi:hypothetical protein
MSGSSASSLGPESFPRNIVCESESEKTPAASSARDDRIARLAVLKSAADFLGQMSQTREEVRSEHVLILADRWLAWVEDDRV